MNEVRSNLNPLAQPFVPHASSSHPSPHCITYSSISIGHINICSLRNKLFVLSKLVRFHNLDILAVSETWLDNSISDSEVDIRGFSMHRLDRKCNYNCSCTNGTPCQKRGGVVIYSRLQLGFKRMLIQHIDLEMVWLRSKKREAGESFLIGCLYRPPSAPAAFWQSLQQVMYDIQGEDLILMGDLNVDFLSPQTHHFDNLNTYLLLPLDLKNMITHPTRITPTSKTLLDCVLTNMDCFEHGSVHSCEFTDHEFVHTSIIFPKSIPTQGQIYRSRRRDYSKASASDLSHLLSISDLGSFSSQSVDVMLEEWQGKFEDALDVVAPYIISRRQSPGKRKKCPFMTPELLALIRRRKTVYRKYRSSDCSSTVLQKEFKVLRSKCNNLYRQLRNAHFRSICDDYRRDPRRLWSTINSVTRRTNPRTEPLVQADTLNRYFHSIVSDPNPAYVVPSGTSRPCDLHEFRPISEDEVLRHLQKLDGTKAPGPDGLLPSILKAVAPVIAFSLTLIFNTSLCTAVFPTQFKLANVTPILKSRMGDPTSPSNYRPVSLTSILAKTLERLVLNQVCDSLTIENHLHDHQFGFRPARSTTQLLTLAVNDWKLAQDRGETTSVAFVDLSKAFDRVQHQQLLIALHGMGVHASALRWFASYLAGRSQRVVTPASQSSSLAVSRGVPQGSILGPTLFNVYLRDLPRLAETAGSKLLMFADDKTVYSSDPSKARSEAKLSSALEILNNHLGSIGMQINTDKTVVMQIHPKRATGSQQQQQRQQLQITLSNVTLGEVESTRCLGVVVDNKLSFDQHINNVVRKASRKIGVLRRSFRQMNLFARRTFVVGVIQPDLEYALPVYLSFISAKNRNKLASLHRRAVRVACGASPQANITPLLHHLNVSSFQYRSVFLFLVFIFHCYCIKPAVCLQSLFPICTSTRTTRGSTTHNMSINRYRSMSGFLSFSSKSALVWNYLPDDLKSCTTIADFRVKLAIWLKDSLTLNHCCDLLSSNVHNQ